MGESAFWLTEMIWGERDSWFCTDNLWGSLQITQSWDRVLKRL